MVLTFDQKVPDNHRKAWQHADWTDDTDQMILIIDSILETKNHVVRG